jgi:thiamine biosynthesis lipoprotein
VLCSSGETGLTTAVFCAFNTVVTLQSPDGQKLVAPAFARARDECHRFEGLFSRHRAHSDIARLNDASGKATEIHKDTYHLLQAALLYCKKSRGRFDITIGAALRHWDFSEEIVPEPHLLEEACCHVDWRALELFIGSAQGKTRYYAQLLDSLAAVDVGGIAKGFIADSLTETLQSGGLENFLMNLGGNTVARGLKPAGKLWRIGIQDPRSKEGILGTLEITDASVVTSGIYERCFENDGQYYHHILDPKTGFSVATDVAGVTVVAQKSLDAEGYSTTLLALGAEAGLAFAQEHPEIRAVYYVDCLGRVTSEKSGLDPVL